MTFIPFFVFDLIKAYTYTTLNNFIQFEIYFLKCILLNSFCLTLFESSGNLLA